MRRGVFLSGIDTEGSPFALQDQGQEEVTIRLRGELLIHHVHELLTESEKDVQGEGYYMFVEEGEEREGVDALVLAAAQAALRDRLTNGRREIEAIEKPAVRDERAAFLNSWAGITSPPKTLGTKKKDAGDIIPCTALSHFMSPPRWHVYPAAAKSKEFRAEITERPNSLNFSKLSSP